MLEAWRNTPETVLGPLQHHSRDSFSAPEGTDVDLAGKTADVDNAFSFLEASLMVTGILNGAVYTHLPIPVSEQPARCNQCCGVRVRGGGEGNRG